MIIIRKVREYTIAEIEKEGWLRDLINALRKFAKTDERVAKVLKEFKLL